MKKWKSILIVVGCLLGLAAAIIPESAHAINVFDQCSGNGSAAVCKAAGTDNATSMIKIVVNTLLFILGIISVIMIIVGGLRYTTSGGDSSATKAAKDTILYAVIGLVVAMLSFTIVNYVIAQF